jgi:hypothetical protein
MLALAFLTITAATEHTCHPPPPWDDPVSLRRSPGECHNDWAGTPYIVRA